MPWKHLDIKYSFQFELLLWIFKICKDIEFVIFKRFQRMKPFEFLHVTSPLWQNLLKTQFWQKSFGFFTISKSFPFSLQKLFFLPQNSTVPLHKECTTGAEYLFTIYTVLASTHPNRLSTRQYPSKQTQHPTHYAPQSKINMAHCIPQLRPDLN